MHDCVLSDRLQWTSLWSSLHRDNFLISIGSYFQDRVCHHLTEPRPLNRWRDSDMSSFNLSYWDYALNITDKPAVMWDLIIYIGCVLTYVWLFWFRPKQQSSSISTNQSNSDNLDHRKKSAGMFNLFMYNTQHWIKSIPGNKLSTHRYEMGSAGTFLNCFTNIYYYSTVTN